MNKKNNPKNQKMPKKKLPKVEDKPSFPHSNFPVKIIHAEGEIIKTCYFQNESHAKKYIDRSKLKKTEYQMYVNEKK